MKIIKFINENKIHMRSALDYVVSDLKRHIRNDPEEYREYECDEPSIDVRLCIDITQNGRHGYTFRTGPSDYDPYHSQYCSASSVTLDTEVDELLDNLINQIEEI